MDEKTEQPIIGKPALVYTDQFKVNEQMGREKVLEKIKKNAGKIVTGGILLFALGFLMSFLFIIGYEGLDAMLVISAFPFLSGLIMIVYGVKIRRDPTSVNCLKKNPRLLEQADELFRDVVYEDSFIIFSQRIIANKADITQMEYLSDVLWIYESKMTQHLFTTLYDVKIRTANRTINVSVYGQHTSRTCIYFNRMTQDKLTSFLNESLTIFFYSCGFAVF